MLRQEIEGEFSNSPAIFVADMDKAIVGYDFTADRVVYSSGKCIRVLMKNNNCTYMDALEYYMHNIEGISKGDHAPLFIECFEGV